jgi:DNA segregation ATPase FtsK/SpoIIIE, S-DNA-T family
MTMPNEFQDDGRADEMPGAVTPDLATSGGDVIEVPSAGEVVSLSDARRARGLDQSDAATGPADEDGALTGEVIDPPAPSGTVRRAHEPLEVLPAWLTSPAALRGAVAREGRFVLSWIGHHGVRLPLYVPKFLARATVGATVCTRAVSRWVTDADHKADRAEILRMARDATEWRELRKSHRDGVRARATALAAAAGTALTGGGVLFLSSPDVATATASAMGMAAVTGFGLIGRKKTAKRITTAAEGEMPHLTVDVVTDALLTLGLGSMGEAKRGNAEIKVLRIFPTTGGVEIHIDLPPGATAADVIERKDRLASALRRPIDCVWPEGNPEAHPSRLNLYVADMALSKRGIVGHTFTKPTNVFENFEIGEDQRGRAVTTCLMYNNGVLGGLPGMGKTFFMRVLMLGAILDPRTELHVHELKGTGDLLPFAPIAHVCRSGDDPDDIRALLADVKAIQAEMRRRSKVIKSLPRDVCPESKVTDTLAKVGNPHGFKPLLLVIDESQLAFTHPDLGAEITETVEDILRRGRALGIMVWLATQRPSSEAIPAGVKALLSLRACLRVGDATTNDMVLGTSMYKAGHRATIFTQSDKGTALYAGETSDPKLVRSAFVDATATDKIVERARAHRVSLDLLTGMAAGDEPADTDHSTIVDHMLAVWPADDAEWTTGRIWSSVLADRLAEHKPALYEGWTGAQVNAAARRHGVTARDVKRPGTTKVAKGLIRDDLVRTTNHDDTNDETGEG